MSIFSDLMDLGIPLATQGDTNKVNQYSQEYLDAARGLDPSQLKSEFAGISTDPSTRMAQMKALQQLSQVAGEQGFDPQSRAANFDAQRESAGYEKSQRDADMARLQARGMGGSGAEIASLMSAEQGGANRAGQQGMQAAADARKRSMMALSQMGDMAGNIRHEDWGEAAQRAGGMDAMTRARYNGSVDRVGALGGAYGFGKKVADEDAARTAAQINSFGNLGDDAFSAAMTGGASEGWSGKKKKNSWDVVPANPMSE